MIITDEEIRKLITLEFEAKALGTIKQYLEIHEAIYDDGQIKIERIDREKPTIVAYLPVKNEYFSFAVYIDPQQKEIISVGTESRNIVSLIATSETLSSKKLRSFTSLDPTEIWDKGDVGSGKKRVYTYSGIEFLLNPEPDEFEDKLKKLLSFLQSDAGGIIELAKNTDAYIRIIMDFHRGNQLLGGASLGLDDIKKLGELNLSVGFEIRAWGNPFK